MKTIRLTLLGAGLVCALILSAAAQEARHLTVIHTFTGGTGTGDPGWLVEDAAGNFYGATSYGGNFHACGGSGCGGFTAFLHTAADGRTRFCMSSPDFRAPSLHT